MKKKNFAFTLVELVTVIIILVILASISFVSYKSYPKKARDSVRVSDLKKIKTILEIEQWRTWVYPLPDAFPWWEVYSWTTMWTWWYDWVFGTWVTQRLWKIELPIDPRTKKPYRYFVKKDTKDKFKLVAMMETNKEYEVWDWDIEDDYNLSLEPKVKNCEELFNLWKTQNKKYLIYPQWESSGSIEVYCDMTNWWYTRYLNIKWNYTLTDAQNCWLWSIINNWEIECFNPNRYSMKADKIRIVKGANSWEYTNLSPNPSFTTQTTKGSAPWTQYCLWWENYMTIDKFNNFPNQDTSDLKHVRLWLSFCNSLQELWWIDKTSAGSIKYYNYSTSWNWTSNSHLSNRELGWEDNAEPIEIYIK